MVITALGDGAHVEKPTHEPHPVEGMREGQPLDAVEPQPLRVADTADDLGLRRAVDRFPFVPDDEDRLAQDCYEAYNIQVSALEQRLRAIGQPKIVIGVSGGLDSTHALIVAARAMDRLGRPRTDILAFTMPGFATSDHTRNNATRLAESLGVTFATLDMKDLLGANGFLARFKAKGYTVLAPDE